MKRFLRSNSDFNFFMEKQLINSNTLNLNKLHDRFEIDNPVDKKKTTDFSLGKSFKFQTPKRRDSSFSSQISFNDAERKSSKNSSSCSPSRTICIVKIKKPFKFLRSSFRLYYKTNEKYNQLMRNYKLETSLLLEVIQFYIKKLMDKQSVERIIDILNVLKLFISSINQFDLTRNSLCLFHKNDLLREFKKLSNEISKFGNDEDYGLIISIKTHLTQICLFIFSKYSIMIEYYSIFLNCLIGKIKNNLTKCLINSTLNDYDFMIYFKIFSIYYKLIENNWKEWTIIFEENKAKPLFSVIIKSRAHYFFNNFYKALFTYSKEIDKPSDNINIKKTRETAYYKIIERRKKQEDFTFYNTECLVISGKNIGEFTKELYIYLNSKLHKWKRTIIQEDEIMKCRICEKDFTLRDLIIHTNRCKIKHDYAKQVKLINNEIIEIISDSKFNLGDNYRVFDDDFEILDINYYEIFPSPPIKKIRKRDPFSIKSFFLTLKKICLSICKIELSDNDKSSQNEFFRMQKYIHRSFTIENKLLERKKNLTKNFDKHITVLNYINSVINLMNIMLSFVIRKKKVYEDYLYLVINYDEKTSNLDLSITSSREYLSKSSKLSSFSDYNVSIKSSSESGKTKKKINFKPKHYNRPFSFSNYLTFDMKSSLSVHLGFEENKEIPSMQSLDIVNSTIFKRNTKKSKFFIEDNIWNKNGFRDSLVDIPPFDLMSPKRIDENFISNIYQSESKKDVIVDYSGNESSDDSDQDISFLLRKFNTILRKKSNNIIEEREHQTNLSLNEFEIIDPISQGGFGRVYLVKKKSTNDYFALKKIYKSYIKKMNLFNLVEKEKTILNNINNDFVVKCYYSFSDRDYIFFVMEFLNGGDLSNFFNYYERLSENEVKYYAAEIILALEYLHSNDIIHRDLKPENIMIDQTGHIKLADFGLSEILEENEAIEPSQSGKLLGTPHYLAPELIMKQPHGKEVDFWALGIIIFELLTGKTPFDKGDPSEITDNIINTDIQFPRVVHKSCLKKKEFEKEIVISEEAFVLLKGLLIKNPKERLGSNSIDDLKKLEFFYDIDFETIMKKKFIFTPKRTSKNKVNGEYFDKSRFNDLIFKPIVELSHDNPKDTIDLENDLFFHQDEDYSIKREDLLHKKNIECINETIKKKKSIFMLDNILCLNYTIQDMNGGEI